MKYKKHLFFCINQRDDGRKCCYMGGAIEVLEYAKQRINRLSDSGSRQIRVNRAGCLGRCDEGPSLVIYPEGVWYTYRTKEDVEEIIQKHILNGEVVKRLLMDPLP